MPDAAIQVSGLKVRRWSARTNSMVCLLDDVTWSVAPGQHWVMMGPNGAGKTTLLRIIGANAHPTEGNVEILGQTLGRYDVRLLRERIGFVDEALEASLRRRGHMSAREILLTGVTGTVALLEERLDTIAESRADELLALVGLTELAERRFDHCSQGERRRLMIARSLMTHPELLLLDEPAAGLDLPSRERFVQTMVNTSKDHPRMPSVTITHHVEEIPPSCTHALLLREGRVLAAGKIADVVTSELVSECFGVDVDVFQRDRRFAATIS